MEEVDRLSLTDIDWKAYLDPDETSNVHELGEYKEEASSWLSDRAEGKGGRLPFGTSEEEYRITEGTVNIYAGTTGSGKSCLLSQIAVFSTTGKYSDNEEKFLYWGPELRPHVNVGRMLRQATGEENPLQSNIDKAMDFLEGKGFLYTKENQVKGDEIIGVSRFAMHELGVKHVFIDGWLKLKLGGNPDNRWMMEADLMDKLAVTSRDTGITFHIAMHSRKMQSDRGKLSLHDIRGAGQLTDLADTACILWRNKHKEEEMMLGGTDLVDEPDCVLIVDKSRHTGQSKWQLSFNKASMQFLNNPFDTPQTVY